MFAVMIVFAYLIGSITFGSLVGKIKGVDLRKVGSGNVGATNVYRTMGWKMGALVFLLDSLKGVLSVWTGYMLGFHGWQAVAIGAATVFGHLYPALKFKGGGKGVATATGVFLVFNTWGLVGALVVFGIAVGLTKYVSFGSILGAETALLIQILSPSPLAGNNLPTTSLSLALLAAIIYSHRSNISRLWRGTENKIILIRKTTNK